MQAAIELHPGLEPIPARLQHLSVHRGYPVPWFVDWENGVPEFRIMDPVKFRRALIEKLCWVCGDKLGKHMTFVAGPMCGVNRTNAEPPCHLECAQWSARNCPFLSKPQMTRREMDKPFKEAAGFAIKRNPGVTLLWITLGYETFRVSNGILLHMGPAERVEWWALGKPATRQQVIESVAGGLPTLQEMARQEEGASEELAVQVAELELLYPKE